MLNGSYTLITGASEGLGKALAIECANRGQNLLLVALPGSGLEHLAEMLKKNFSVTVNVFEKDLARENSCLELFEEINKYDFRINILINNAGMGNTRLFEEVDLKIYEKQIKLNVLATMSLTHLFIPMLKRNRQAYILNVGSLASFFTMPRKQVYGGTKSFIYFFSKSLRLELYHQRISVSVLCPGGINSNANQTMLNKSGTRISQLSLMNPEEIAPLAIDGLLKKKEVIIPGTLNRLFVIMNQLVPEYFKQKIIQYQIGKLKSTTSLTVPV